MLTREQLIEAGAEKLADILLSLYNNQKELQKQLDIFFAGLDEDPKKQIALIKKEISSLKRSSRFVDYYESGDLAGRLDQLRLSIVIGLAARAPEQAIQYMKGFLVLVEPTCNRVDDSNGVVGSVFSQAVHDLAMLHQGKACSEEIIAMVFDCFMDNGYGIYDEIILHFKDVLGKEGLVALKEKIKAVHTEKNAHTVTSGLEAIADAGNDVDAYIDACRYKRQPVAHDHLEIAKRLIAHWRGEEALNWLARFDLPATHHWQENRSKLTIEALELIGRYSEAQAERIRWFWHSLDPGTYGQVLSHSKEEDKAAFRQQALEKALAFPDPYKALIFFVEVQDSDSAAKVVQARYKELDGRHYYTLRPVADFLREVEPMAATLLYRTLISSVMGAGKSTYYNYAAKDVIMCELLAGKVTDWVGFKEHTAYMEDLKAAHKKKSSFWAEYQSQLQKQVAKQAKLQKNMREKEK